MKPSISLNLFIRVLTIFSTCSRYKHQPLHLQHDHHHHQARRLKPRQIADAANRGCGKSRIHPDKTKERTATDIVS